MTSIFFVLLPFLTVTQCLTLAQNIRENPRMAYVSSQDQGPVSKKQDRPIVAILSQEMSHTLENLMPETANYSSYIGAAYIKYIEAAGARAVPVLINQDDDYYEFVFNSTNGLLIPGGAVSLTESGYAKAGLKLYELALNSWDTRGVPYPIWGTCLGFEFLASASIGGQAFLASCSSQDQPLALNFTEDWAANSSLAADMPKNIEDILANENVTPNFHRYCLTPANFTKFHMDQFWHNLATSLDWEGTEFIALIEAKNYPIWGSQFHPEKVMFEWTRKYENIPHSRSAVESAMYFAQFFVEQCRKNDHQFSNRTLEEQNLIYSFNPIFTGDIDMDWVMQQVYAF